MCIPSCYILKGWTLCPVGSTLFRSPRNLSSTFWPLQPQILGFLHFIDPSSDYYIADMERMPVNFTIVPGFTFDIESQQNMLFAFLDTRTQFHNTYTISQCLFCTNTHKLMKIATPPPPPPSPHPPTPLHTTFLFSALVESGCTTISSCTLNATLLYQLTGLAKKYVYFMSYLCTKSLNNKLQCLSSSSACFVLVKLVKYAKRNCNCRQNSMTHVY